MNTINNPEVNSSSEASLPSSGGSSFGACGTAALSYMMLNELRQLYAEIAAIMNTGLASSMKMQGDSGVASAQAGQAMIEADGINMIIQGAEAVAAGIVSGVLAAKSGQMTEEQAAQSSLQEDNETQLKAVTSKIAELKGASDDDAVNGTEVLNEEAVQTRMTELKQAAAEKNPGAIAQDRSQMTADMKIMQQKVTDQALERLAQGGSNFDLDTLADNCNTETTKAVNAQKSIQEQITAKASKLQLIGEAVSSGGTAISNVAQSAVTLAQKAKNQAIQTATQTTSQISAAIASAYLQSLQGEWQDMEALNQTQIAINQSQNTRG